MVSQLVSSWLHRATGSYSNYPIECEVNMSSYSKMVCATSSREL